LRKYIYLTPLAQPSRNHTHKHIKHAGTNFQYCRETKKGSGKFGAWQPEGKVYEISGQTGWGKAILVRGQTVDAAFESDGSGERWGYRYLCRPATDVELASVQGRFRQNVPVDEFECATSPQSNGGEQWEKVVADATGKAAMKKFREFMKMEAAWFGSLTVDEQFLRQKTIRGTAMMRLLEASWGADGSGANAGGYPFWTHVLHGRSTLVIAGKPGSSLKLLEMMIRVGIIVSKGTPQEAFTLIVASLAAQSKMGNGNTSLWRELHSYNDPAFVEERVSCYTMNVQRERDAATKRHVCCHLQKHGEILHKLCGKADFSFRRPVELAKAVRLRVSDLRQESADTVRISNYARAAHECQPVSMGPASFSEDDFTAFMTQPLSSFVDFSEYITSVNKESGSVPNAPPFDLSGHPDAETVNAKATMTRITDDCEYYAEKENNAKATVCVGITPRLMQAYESRQDAAGGPSKEVSPAFAGQAKGRLASLKSTLQDALRSESERLNAATAHMLSEANNVPGTSEDALRFKLLQKARLQAAVTLPHLVACLVSTQAIPDIRALNPFISERQVNKLLNATAGVVLVANRVSQLQRTIGCVDDVTKAISRCIDAKKMRKEIGGLIGNLLSKRHYGCKGDSKSYKDPIDPRFLLFEYMTTFVLRKAQVYLVNTFIQRATRGGKNAHGEDTNSMVHQMIMGAGKTTIIGPLLALMLADGKSLVTQVVPNALLTMSRNVMWGRFCNVVVKPVFTLTFDRGWPTKASVYQHMYEKMVLARQTGGIVVTTPSAIKSIVNKYVELLNSVAEAPLERLVKTTKASKAARAVGMEGACIRAEARLSELQNCSDTADAIARIMTLWSDRERGVLLMDEVDMLLHPLRSELNFPIGEKFALTPSPSRWNLPMHLLDTVLQAASGAIAGRGATASQGGGEGGVSSTADKLVRDLEAALAAGFRSQRLQSVPHLVLLDASFYEEELRPLVVKRAVSWMKAHHVFEGVDAVPSADTLEAYVLRGNLASESDVLVNIRRLPGNVLQVLNLAKDCTGSFLPHILAKIDRVSFGLLQPADLELLKGKEQPLSRKLLGIPFAGKDVPSGAAEFAQPDVLIAATILAYRYEGLRKNDLKSSVRLLKEAMQLESGPKQTRPAYALFEKWVSAACLRRGPAFKRAVMNLELFQLSDTKQMQALFELLRMEPQVIHHYLREIAFPSTMHQQRVKISSSGQELGSDILFGRRLGFSGTPSNLLPVDIVPCHFEKGSEGKIIRSLTDDEVTMEAPMSRMLSEDGAKPWSVRGVLDMIAQSTEPEYRALIDTGALITGYSNEEVARYLVDTGLRHLQGCVFLDHRDRKMIYLRGAARCIPLSECGIGRGERFTFYDQVHTTGMDIKQSLSACALLTIGKDMIFRDYAQGAYRMRGIGKGQTIHLFIVPEIKKLIRKTLPRVTGHVEDDVAAWLQLNNMKIEKLQFLQLCSQSMQTVWRKVAMDALLSSSGVEGVNVVPGLLGSSSTAKKGMTRFEGGSPSVQGLKNCIGALRDAVDFDVPQGIPVNEPYSATLQKMVDANSTLVKTSHQKKVVQIVMKQVDDALKSAAARASSGAKKGLNSEMTREKEREQEQQKQKQQQQQNESMFAKDDSAPYAWNVDLLCAPPRSSSDGFPFYTLNSFSPRPKDFAFRVPGKSEPTVFPAVKPLEFPSNVLQSLNFAPLSRADATKPLRLKNVSMILDWFPDVGRHADQHNMIVLTLSEAESLRRLIQAKNKGERAGRHLEDKVAIAIVKSPDGTVVEATKNYPGFGRGSGGGAESKTNQAAGAGSAVMGLEGACLKFVNNNMYYEDEEISALLSAMGSSTIETRRAYFEASIAARRRSRKSWTGTPLRAVFAFEGQEQFTEMLDLISACQAKLKTTQQDMTEACDAADADGNGFLSQSEIMSVFQGLGLPISPAQMLALMQLMDADGDNAVDYGEFAGLFAPEATAQTQLAVIQSGGSGTRGNVSNNNTRNSSESKTDEADRRRKRDEERRRRRMQRMDEQRRREDAEAEQRRQEARRRRDGEGEARREAAAREQRRALEAERKRRREEQVRQREERARQQQAERRAERSRLARERREREAQEREKREAESGGGGEKSAEEEQAEREARLAEEDRLLQERLAKEEREREERWQREDQERREQEEREDRERRESEAREDRELREAEGGGGGGGSSKSDGIREGSETKTEINKDGVTVKTVSGNVISDTIEAIDWGAIDRRCEEEGAVAINGLKCCDTRCLPCGNISRYAGCSGENQCCCFGCNFCCKVGAEKFHRSRPQAIAMPCCVCGQAENECKSGRCCHTRTQLCCCIQNCCVVSPGTKKQYPDMMYPQMAIFGYTFKPEVSKGFLKPLVEAGAPAQAGMTRKGDAENDDQAVVSEEGVLLSQKGVDFGTIKRKCHDEGAITVNALGCVETRLLKASATLENLGCSGEHALGCLFCNYCCKRNADKYSKGRAQAIAFPCCLFGCIEPEFRQGRCCQWRFQCCCCLQSCCCVMGKAKAYPGYAYPQMAIAGYSIKPTKGCCKMVGENEDGVVAGMAAGTIMDMER
jgi:hypothetical protein